MVIANLPALHAQSPATSPPEFDAASIKPASSPAGGRAVIGFPGRLEFTPGMVSSGSFSVSVGRVILEADAAVPPDAGEIHLVLDNYGTYKTPSVVRWFARHPRYQLLFTPTSGSWVNQVERWFRRSIVVDHSPACQISKRRFRITSTTITSTRNPSSGPQTPNLT
jgi:hypothetical protein